MLACQMGKTCPATTAILPLAPTYIRKAPYQTGHINITCGIVFHVKEKKPSVKNVGVPRRQKLLQFTTTIATILNTNTT